VSLFIEWNRLLLSHYFPPSEKGEEVWLQTTRVELDSIGLRLGGAEGLIAAVQQGPPWLRTYSTIAEAAAFLARQRKTGLRPESYIDPGSLDSTYEGVNAPTHLPYLALWVLAAADSVDGFYASVEKMSERTFFANDALREQMVEAWRDLADWTIETQKIFGFFAIRRLGGYRYVGVPRSQCLVTQKDKLGLPSLFAECGLRPRQDFTDEIFRHVASRATDAYYLSNSLKSAFLDERYSEPLQQMLSTAFRYWNGNVSRRYKSSKHTRNDGSDAQTHVVEDVEEVSVLLALVDNAELEWAVGWRVPVDQDSFELKVIANNYEWRATLQESGVHASTLGGGGSEEARSLLGAAGDNDVDLQLSYHTTDDQDIEELRKFLLPKKDLRIFVWGGLFGEASNYLAEDDIALSGPTYILFHQRKRRFLNGLFQASRASWEIFSSKGLPESWEIGCIKNSEHLSSGEREQLTDSPVVDSPLARIKFVGGRPLRRGGANTYAFYDLPVVEIEAPDGATIAGDGLEFVKFNSGLCQAIDGYPSSKNLLGFSAAQTKSAYSLRLIDNRKALFAINVLKESRVIASATLKVNVAGGLGLASGRSFGVGPIGESLNTGSHLAGVLCDGAGHPVDSPRDVKVFDSRYLELRRSTQDDIDRALDSVAAKFLDSLAQLGSVAYGSARDQISRLSAMAGKAVEPAIMLLELRSLGHLEIETDHEGHLIRIFAIPPTVYGLSVSRDSKVVYAICGTPRLQHWRDLFDCFGEELFTDIGSKSLLISFKIAAAFEDVLAFAQMSEFRHAKHAATSIAFWAGGLDEFQAASGHWGWEQGFSAELNNLKRFQAVTADFIKQDSQQILVNEQIGASLYRFDDPLIKGLTVYIFGSIGANQVRRFSFLRDSRWGVWLMLGAFAEFVKRDHKNDSAVPWPIHYDYSTGDFWLPARLRPPFVIERALILSSGGIPAISSAIPFDPNPVYSSMVSGKWVRYSTVSSSVAMRVAELLRSALVPVSSHV
jgi:hypothetical protein